MSREAAFQDEVRQNLRRNYSAQLVHGLLGQTGFRLIHAPTFIPDFLFLLSGSNLVVGLGRGLQALGMALTPIFAASIVENRKRVLPVGFLVGALMRVQVLGIALAGFFLPAEWQWPAVVGLLGLFGFFLGMQGVVFNTLVSKVIPVERRGLLMGLRQFLSGIVAAVVGGLGGWFIQNQVLGNGYATTFLTSFVLTALGLCALVLVREPESPSVLAKSRVHQRLRQLPALLREDRTFTWYFIARSLGVAGRMAVPFYLLYAKTRLDVSDAELGVLTAGFVLAQSSFALVWGMVADRTGFRATFLMSMGAWIGSACLLLATTHFLTLLVVFTVLGAGWGGFMLSSQNLVLEFGAREDIPMRIAVANTTSEAVGVVGPIAAGLLADQASYVPVIALAIAFKVLAFGVMLFGVDEPRRRVEVFPDA